MTSFNTGTAVSSGNTQATSQAITVPAGVLNGDLILVVASQVPLTGTTTDTISAASTGTAPVQVGSTQHVANSIPSNLNAAVFKVAAGASDAGKVITVSSTESGFWAVALAAYTGTAGASAIDVSGGTAAAAGASSVTCPAETTGVNGDWAIYLHAGADQNHTLTGPAGTTQRAQVIDVSSALTAAIYDSNAGAGNAGASIGGGTFSAGVSTNNLLAAFTIGLAGGTVYALQQFVFHNTVTGAEECVIEGEQRNSATSQACLQTPASFWSASPLTVGTQISPKLAAYLLAYPGV